MGTEASPANDVSEALTPEKRDIKLRRLRWIVPPIPPRLHKFFYSKRNFLICLVLAVAVYFLTSSLDEMIRRTLVIFVFAAGCWILEVFPLPITGLMIPVAVTLLGIFPPAEAFAPFAHPVIFLLIGGLVLGQAFKKHGLDKRIAYYMILRSGGNIDRIVLLIIVFTAFLSMWMSNTVAIAVLLPVILTILSSIPAEYVNLRKKILLGMTMSTTLGGMAMLTGSTPNLIAAAALEAQEPFGFSQWAYYGVPVVIFSLLIIYFYLKYKYPSPKITLDIASIEEQSRKAGPMNADQRSVTYIFGITIFLWFFGSQTEVWLGLPPSVSSAAIVSILSVMLMFGLGLLDLKDVTSVQWELLFLVGGGILLGEAMLYSGTASSIGSVLASMESSVDAVVILLIFILLSLIMTNFISNSATAAILSPIAIETAYVLDMSPVPFVMGLGLAASVAFITPVGTPSTAMIYATGMVPKSSLIKNGLIVGLATALVILVFLWLLPVP